MFFFLPSLALFLVMRVVCIAVHSFYITSIFSPITHTPTVTHSESVFTCNLQQNGPLRSSLLIHTPMDSLDLLDIGRYPFVSILERIDLTSHYHIELPIEKLIQNRSSMICTHQYTYGYYPISNLHASLKYIFCLTGFNFLRKMR